MLRVVMLGISGFLAGLAWAPPVSAQSTPAAAEPAATATGGLETITVSAERQTEDLQKTPINIQVVTGETINEQGLQNMEDALTGIPGISVQGQVRGFVPSIRGLGTDLPPGSAQGSVATEVDGVYDIRAEVGRVGYYDLDRIEALAGPQGTLYGVNSDGGVVNIISNSPVVGEFQASGGLTLGNYNLVQGQGMVNMPVSPNSALRIAVATVNRDGFLTNTGADDNVASGGRIKYLWKPAEGVSLLAGVEVAKLGGVGSGAVNSYLGGNCQNPTVNGVKYTSCWTDQSGNLTEAQGNDLYQWDRYHSTKYWSEVKWQLQDFSVTFTPSYKNDYDEQNSCGMGACVIQSDPIKLEQNSEELRFASVPGSSLQWAAGLYHWGYLEQESGMGPVGTPPITYYQTSSGAFGQLTYSLNEQTRLIAGLRETQDWKTQGGLPGSGAVPIAKTWDHLDYRAAVEYDVTPQAMAYATLASGYRPGGYNGDQTQYQTEQITDLEGGIKSRFWDNRLQLNADAYIYHIQNYQLLDFYFPLCNGPPGGTDTVNLGARNFGADLSLTALITNDDKIQASVTYMDDNFTSSALIYYNGPTSCQGTNGPEVGSYVVSSSPLPRSPKTSGNLSYSHTFGLPSGATIVAQPSLYMTSSFYDNPVEYGYSFQPGYATENFSLTYKSADAKWSLALWGRNLSDEAVKIQLNPAIIGEPRTFGFTVQGHLY